MQQTLLNLVESGPRFRGHLTSDVNNLQETFSSQMAFLPHQVNDSAELSKIHILLRSQRMLEKKLAHLIERIQLANSQTISVIMVSQH